MKGRLTREKVNGGLDFLNRVLGEKYAFLRQNPARLSIEMRQKYHSLRDDECDEVSGKFFVTEADLRSALSAGKSVSFKLDPTGRSVLAILRHLGRIREVRGAGIIRYVATLN